MLESRNVLTTEKTAVFAPSASAIVSTATAQAALRRIRKRRPASRPRERRMARMMAVRCETPVGVRHATPAPAMGPTQPRHAVYNEYSCEPHVGRTLEEPCEATRFGCDPVALARREWSEQLEGYRDALLVERATPEAH